MRIVPAACLFVVLTGCSLVRRAEPPGTVSSTAKQLSVASASPSMNGLLAALTPGRARLLVPSLSDAFQPAEVSPVNSAEAYACPANMVLVDGMYCPEVEQRCARWLESDGRYAYFRCAEYARPAKCLASRRALRFCIDRDEYAPSGESLPASRQSWTNAAETCSSLGKRVCLESEYNFACEGEEMRPYPYGFTRDSDACNADRVDIYRADGMLRDLREGPSGHPRCLSPFGVHNLAGNLEEWTTIDGSDPQRPAMKGAYWQPSRNHCRAAQTAHDAYYHGDETGFRCCKESN